MELGNSVVRYFPFLGFLIAFCSYGNELPLHRENYLSMKMVNGGTVVFASDYAGKSCPNICWIYFNDELLIESRPAPNGSRFNLDSDPTIEILSDANGNYIRENGRLVLTRMIAREMTAMEADNHYFLLDFRNKKPLIVGPMGGDDASEKYSVIWNDRSVILILDDGVGGGKNGWKKGTRYIVPGEHFTPEGAPDLRVPIINQDGKPHKRKKSKKREFYRAYLYDYDKNEVTEVAIEN